MRVGVIAALPAEARVLCRDAGPHRTAQRGALQVRVSGMGPARAQAAAAALLEAGCEALLSWGCGGGLDAALHPGAVVIADAVASAGGELLAVDAGWAERAVQRLHAAQRGILAESTDILFRPADKAALANHRHAVVCDMESAAVARVAAAAGRPFLALRAVADPAGLPLPRCLYDALDPYGRVQAAPFVRQLAMRPWEVTGLLRLGRNFGAALRALRVAAGSLGPELAATADDPVLDGA